MTYEDLVAYCARAVVIQGNPQVSLLDCVNALMMHSPANRAITAEVLARFMAEHIEYDRPKKVMY